MNHQRLIIASLTILLMAPLLSACQHKKAPPLSDEEIRKITEGEPQIFIENNQTLSLEGIEDLYLGQSEDEALKILSNYCQTLEVFQGGWRHNDAVFKGCIIDDGPDTWVLRVGFWPHRGNQVSTLEIKNRPLTQPLVRARFAEISGELLQDLPRNGILMMATEEYRLFANWDDGTQGQAHLIIGFQP